MKKVLSLLLVMTVLICTVTLVSCVEIDGGIITITVKKPIATQEITTVQEKEPVESPIEDPLSYSLEFTINDDGESYSVTGIGTRKDRELVIPSQYRGLPVTSVGNDFASRGDASLLTSVTIPDSVTSIGHCAFYGCTSLESVKIPDSVTYIGTSAFENCESLTSITIPDAVTFIGNRAFYGCTFLTEITIPDSVTEIKNATFHTCTFLTSITIPDSVTSIGDFAFSGCTSLTSIIIPDSVTIIGDSAFTYCTSLTIYCEVKSEPSGWDIEWNASNRPVVWGYKETK